MYPDWFHRPLQPTKIWMPWLRSTELKFGQRPALRRTKGRGLSNSTDFIRQVFSLAKDEIGTAIKNDEGYAILSVAEIQPTHQGRLKKPKSRSRRRQIGEGRPDGYREIH
jgi:hypothetical protein